MANPGQKVDVVAAGATLVVVLDDGGTYEWTLTPPGGAPETSTGTWSVSSDIFTIKETGSSGDMQFDWSLAGATLTLAGANTDYDFDGDDVSEAARLSAELIRR